MAPGIVARVATALDPRGTTSAPAIWSVTLAWTCACLTVTPLLIILDATSILEAVGRARPPIPGLPLSHADLFVAAAWTFAALLVAGVVLLPCLFARRLRDAGVSVRFAVLPFLAPALWSAGSTLADAGPAAFGYLLVAAALSCWLATAVLASLPTRTAPVPA